MSKRSLPSNASVATEGQDGRLVAPAATRNAKALCELLTQWAPKSGQALEIASGTGQHVSAFAQALPDLLWQPTEVEPDRRASIDAYAADLPNVADAAALDATAQGWHESFAGQDLIVLINLLHLISWPEAQALIAETAQALAPRGRFILYGPFKRSGQLTSDGDQRFHDALVQEDPEIGYKDDRDIAAWMAGQNLTVLDIVEMPANNLAFIAEKPGT
jgi:SAM-dependent methyltransferase